MMIANAKSFARVKKLITNVANLTLAQLTIITNTVKRKKRMIFNL